MSDPRGKRKYAGPTIGELRKVDQDPIRLPPHKKPKVWKLTIEWTETKRLVREQEFTSKAARDESRARIERHFREVAARAKAKPQRYKAWHWGVSDVFYGYHDIEAVEVHKEGPKFIEYYGDAAPSEEG